MIAGPAKDDLLRALTRAEAEVRAIEASAAGDASCLEVLARVARTVRRLDDAGSALLLAHADACVARLNEDQPAYARDLLDVVRRYSKLH